MANVQGFFEKIFYGYIRIPDRLHLTLTKEHKNVNATVQCKPGTVLSGQTSPNSFGQIVDFVSRSLHSARDLACQQSKLIVTLMSCVRLDFARSTNETRDRLDKSHIHKSCCKPVALFIFAMFTSSDD